MIDNLSKKIIFFLLLLFFVGNNTALALVVTATENVTISATVGSSAVVPPGNSITGGMGIPKTSVRFSGEAYPNSIVTILENGVIRTSTQANSLGYFEVTLEEKYNNNVLYTLFANDTSGNRSLLLNYPIVIYNGYLTYISGIRFAPTISTDKLEVRLEDYLTVSGSALPNADMGVTIGGNTTQVFTLTSNKDGSYKIILPLSNMSKGDYSVYANYTNDSRISNLIKFSIGDTNIVSPETVTNIPGDCNADRIIDLVDFSILAFWYGKSNPPPCVDTNRDGIINLVDFSILAFYWTG